MFQVGVSKITMMEDVMIQYTLSATGLTRPMAERIERNEQKSRKRDLKEERLFCSQII